MGHHKRCNTVCVMHLLLLHSLIVLASRYSSTVECCHMVIIADQCSLLCKWQYKYTVFMYTKYTNVYLCVFLIRLRGLQRSFHVLHPVGESSPLSVSSPHHLLLLLQQNLSGCQTLVQPALHYNHTHWTRIQDHHSENTVWQEMLVFLPFGSVSIKKKQCFAFLVFL